ncbi:hypothetical protein OG871_19255 [Kitasatospora sp. NBC_00374]|uniref:hypothetical protein n=1 Tax=Kitasatospora sp. NBC_00374 TaxID=2975964 RepID=UPI003249BAE9
MYLIHALLRPGPRVAELPDTTAELIRRIAHPQDRVEHVSVHRRPGFDPVIGVYLLADRLEEAEDRTAALCRRAVEELPALRGWQPGRVGAPLVAPFYERMLAGSGPAGRNGPRPLPSS